MKLSILFVLLFTSIIANAAPESNASEEYDIWTTRVDDSLCTISGGIVASHPGGETRVIAYYTTAFTHDKVTKSLGLELNKPQLVIESQDKTLAPGYEILLIANDVTYRAWPKEGAYTLNAKDTASLIKNSKNAGSFKLGFMLANGSTCIIELGYKDLAAHIKEATGCGYESIV